MRFVGSLIKILLLPFSLIYGSILTVRNWCFELGILKEQSFPIPIISVGNITVGGTGKTPHVEYLIELLLKHGFSVGVLSRGYGRSTEGFLEASSESEVSEIGDEPRQIKLQFPQIVLAVDENRCHGIKLMMEQHPTLQVIVLDDAFQHRYVKAGLSLLLNDYNRPMYKDFVFPAGRLREPAWGRKRADLLIVSKCPKDLSTQSKEKLSKCLKKDHQALFFTYYDYAPLQGLWEQKTLELSEITKTVLLVTGIASPRLIENYLRAHQIRFESLSFKDHHNFTATDYELLVKKAETLEDCIFVTTAKDAMRFECDGNFPSRLKNHFFILPLELQFLEQQEAFNSKIINYVRTNQSNS